MSQPNPSSPRDRMLMDAQSYILRGERPRAEEIMRIVEGGAVDSRRAPSPRILPLIAAITVAFTLAACLLALTAR